MAKKSRSAKKRTVKRVVRKPAKRVRVGKPKPAARPFEKVSVDELLKKAYEPARLAMIYHPFYEGKIEVVPKCAIWDFNAFAIWYTPGVAEPCKAISKDKDLSYVHTNRWNTVGVISDGT
ncbi:MAG: malate dehydrogenase, partial [Thermoplasmata archaeon]